MTALDWTAFGSGLGLCAVAVAWRERPPLARVLLVGAGIIIAFGTCSRAHAACLLTGTICPIEPTTGIVHAGDEVSVEARACTDDIQRMQLFHVFLTIHSQPGDQTIYEQEPVWNGVTAFSYTAKVDGDLPSSALLGIGTDGHEGCTVRVSAIGPNVQHRMSADQKQKARNVIAATTKVNIALGATGIVCLIPAGGVSSTCAAVLIAFATINNVAANYLQEALDHDPLSEYQVVYVPVVDPVPSNLARTHWRNLIAAEQQVKALTEAIMVSVNRAGSAAAAGDMQAVALQQGAIDSYVVQLRQAFLAEIPLRQEFAAVYPNASVIVDPTLLNALRGF